MHDRVWAITILPLLGGLAAGATAAAQPPARSASPACRLATIEGQLEAGKTWRRPIGNGLAVWFEPIAAGWILRVIPAAGPLGDHDYAELATPPYRSVTPLSISTDFSFRAQDAVGWNPRRFHFATSSEEFSKLLDVYQRYTQAGASPPAPLEVELSGDISEASEGTLTILDARLVPGMADQWRMAGAVASHFATTAHTLVNPVDGKPSALGKLLWLSFRLEFELPKNFSPAAGLRVLPHLCSNR